jgi:hypothetical protein
MKRVLLILLLFTTLANKMLFAQEVVADTIVSASADVKPMGRPGAMKWEGPKEEKLYFISGFGVSADVVGLVMKSAGSTFSQIEIAGRLNIREKIFPIFELGVAEGNRIGNSKDNEFHTTAPYFRAGFDINANKKRTSNRLMLGFRFGYSSFEYDFIGPAITDPVWGETIPIDMRGIDASAMWGEAVFGLEAKIWSFIRIGWNARYKFRFSQKYYEFGEPWYIPGFGPNGPNCWGGTVNLIFDFGRTMKKGK